jgi:simple sugar transport system ATP-binding protein
MTVIAAERVTKRFAGVTALRGVDFSVEAGEVRGLLGKNGAGKSTLIKILSGVQAPDEGGVLVEGELVHFKLPSDALAAGIATVYQELSVVPEMSVAENVLLGRWPRTARGPIDWKALRRQAREALSVFDRPFDVDARVAELSIADRQLVEIARALSRDAKLLILDEPTSSLAAHEVDILLQAVRTVSRQGVAVIYISHRLAEIANIADTATVLRDGEHVGTVAGNVDPSVLVSMIFGDAPLPDRFPRAATPGPDDQPVLDLTGVRLETKLRDVDLKVRRCEILGLAGLHGSGRTELLRAIAGLDPIRDGAVRVNGREIRRPSVRRMLSAGVALAPEDRRREGIFPLLGVDENLVNGRWGRVTNAGVIQRRSVEQRSDDLIARLGVRTARRDTPIGTLSGGNQQKVVIGRWLDPPTTVLLLDEPTRGVDLRAKEQIFDLVRQLADSGVGVVFVSSEFEELTAVCDSIAVVRNGTVETPIPAVSTSPEQLLELASREDAV